nr:MAG TPA: hypothetical protein [Caudoviricetes sp.]
MPLHRRPTPCPSCPAPELGSLPPSCIVSRRPCRVHRLPQPGQHCRRLPCFLHRFAICRADRQHPRNRRRRFVFAFAVTSSRAA